MQRIFSWIRERGIRDREQGLVHRSSPKVAQGSNGISPTGFFGALAIKESDDASQLSGGFLSSLSLSDFRCANGSEAIGCPGRTHGERHQQNGNGPQQKSHLLVATHPASDLFHR